MIRADQYCVIGSPAAIIQSRFWGAAVKEGSWFSYLQRAGMKGVTSGTGKKIIGGVGAGMGIGTILLQC